jgi:hypothetical protein
MAANNGIHQIWSGKMNGIWKNVNKEYDWVMKLVLMVTSRGTRPGWFSCLDTYMGMRRMPRHWRFESRLKY